jgi:hypothetical protein
MTTDDLLNIEITPADQQLAARLGLASIDSDHSRYCQVLAEVQAGGMPTAIAVIAILNNHLVSGMANAIGVAKIRALFEATILDAGQADQ